MTTQVAFLFPGQGSQAVGMGADVFAVSKAAQQVFEAADDALGFSLSDLCFRGPEDTLRETVNAQPAIVTVSLALLAALQEALSRENASSEHPSSWSTPLVPSFTAGHSVGEYAALVASNALDLGDAVKLVRERGRLMHHEGTVCPGGMAAIIGMDEEPLQEVCREATAQLTANRAVLSDKIRALATFVQKDIRYVAIEIGIGGYKPHAAPDVLKYHYGDCKDKATLLAALLKEIGVDSYFVLAQTSRGFQKRSSEWQSVPIQN